MRFKLLILIITTSLSAQNIANSLETVINGFNGRPEFLNCAYDLSNELSHEEKTHFYWKNAT